MARRQQTEQFNTRWFLAIGASVVIASAVLLAFTPDDDQSGTRTEASRRVEGLGSGDVDGRGFVRARGGGSVDRGSSGDQAPPTPGVAAASAEPGTPGTDPTPTPDEITAIRQDVANEMRERIGDEADTPEGKQLAEEAATLVEGGSEIEEAVTNVLAPPEP